MMHELKGDVCFPCLGGCVVTLRAVTHEVASSNKTILCNLCFVAELIQRSHFEKTQLSGSLSIRNRKWTFGAESFDSREH